LTDTILESIHPYALKQENAMEIKQAAFSSNAAIASTAQNVASGIEKAALQTGGISGVADSFQNLAPSSAVIGDPSKLSQLASAGMIDQPNQYASRLNDFHREASGLVPSDALIKNLIDSNLDVIKGVIDFASQLKDLEGQDKLGNVEIQDLMSTFKEANTLSSSLQKMYDDLRRKIVQNMG
jgi:hypothetical protein